MAFDIASGVAPRVNTGALMQFQNPDSSPMVNDQKQPVGAIMRARNSEAGLAQLRANGDKRLSESMAGQGRPSVRRGEADVTELLVACTVEFVGIDMLDGVAIDPKSEAFARSFWGDDRFRRHRMQAEDWIGNEANFTKA